MAVWGQPAPVVTNDHFHVNVGVRCGEGCELTGQSIRVIDESGVEVGEGKLGDTPWAGTGSLYVARVPLRAPSFDGVSSWSVDFDPIGLPLPHLAGSASLGFRTVKPPDHIVTVKVIDPGTETPLADAQVHLDIYHGATNEEGLVKLALPKAAYQINVRKAGYECVPTPIDVIDDLDVQVTVSPVQDNLDDELWM